jgi:hypothetical protein
VPCRRATMGGFRAMLTIRCSAQGTTEVRIAQVFCSVTTDVAQR